MKRTKEGMKRLTPGMKLGYGVCDLGGNLFFTVIGFLLMNFLTDTVGLLPALAGTVVAIGKVWDAVTDPITGFLSDRTKTRFGRRRPWMLLGSVPLFFTMIILFTNPGMQNQTYLFIWGVMVFCLVNTAYTAVNIPYNSLTPELTRDYHERTSLNGYRFGFAAIGTITGSVAALPVVGLFPDRNTGFTAMGTLFGLIMMVTALITVAAVREPACEPELRTRGFFKTYLKVFKNRPFVLILLTYSLHLTALSVVMGIAIYYFKYIHNNEGATAVAMGILIVVALIFIPISVVFSRRFGKKPAYSLGLAVFAAALIVLSFTGHLFHIHYSFGLMVFAGIGLGFMYAIPWAMVPDAVEYDYLLTGERTEGAFYGVWTFGIKIGMSMSMAIIGGVLSLVGYVPNVAQTGLSLLGIRMLLGPIAGAIFILGIVVLYFYPINEKRYREILKEIAEMEQQSPSAAC